jgi:hypothetical protein
MSAGIKRWSAIASGGFSESETIQITGISANRSTIRIAIDQVAYSLVPRSIAFS